MFNKESSFRWRQCTDLQNTTYIPSTDTTMGFVRANSVISSVQLESTRRSSENQEVLFDKDPSNSAKATILLLANISTRTCRDVNLVTMMCVHGNFPHWLSFYPTQWKPNLPKSLWQEWSSPISAAIVKCGEKLVIHSQTSTVQPLKFGNGWTISSHTLLGTWLHIHAAITVNPC